MTVKEKRIVLSGVSLPELNGRIEDMQNRGWQLKQIVEDNYRHYGDFSEGTRLDKKIVRSYSSLPKHRAVMVKEE